MKLKILLLTALLFSAALISYSQPRYECHCAPGIIVIDGKLDEFPWKSAPWSDTFKDISGDGFPEPSMSTRFKMLYDERNLYIGAEIIEKNITGSLTQHDAIIYHDNDFEVFIDPYGDGRNYFEFEFNTLGTTMDLIMTKPYSEGGTFIMDWDCQGLQIKTSLDGTLNDSSDTDKAWYIEIAIPLTSIERKDVTTRPSDVWRMNFSRVEWLLKEGPEENWVWSPTGKIDIHIPSKWGYIDFQY